MQHTSHAPVLTHHVHHTHPCVLRRDAIARMFQENGGALEVTVSLLQPEMDTFMWEKATGLLQAVAINPSYRSEIGAQSIEHLLRILQQVSRPNARTHAHRTLYLSLSPTLTLTHKHAILNPTHPRDAT
jgi:hypothetical protein